jgi:hypothetical protein
MKRVFPAVIFAICAASLASAADPDFFGVWSLDESRSEIRRSADRPWKLMKVDHKDTEIHCVPVESGAAAQKATPLAMHFATNGKETAHPIGDALGKSIAKWEGSALMINTIVSSSRQSYTQMDRWKLSRDGKVLTIRRQIVNLHGEIESTLIYNKQ